MDIQWSLLAFSLIAGAGGSLIAFVGLSQLLGYAQKSRKVLAGAAVALVVVGGICSVFHLEQKANIMAAAANIFSFSPISMELIMVGVTTMLGIVYLVLLVKEAGVAACKVLAVLCMASGIALGLVTGSGYMMGSQPFWNTPLLPLAYLGTDLALGGALYLTAVVALKDAEDIGRVPALASLASAVFSFAFCLAYGISTGLSLQPVLFWVGVMGVGALLTAVCALLLFLKAKKGEDAALPLCAGNVVFALCASTCLRAFMWLLGTGTLSLFASAAAHAVL